MEEWARQCQLCDETSFGSTYYRPTRYESVEMDAASNAGHVVDPASDMQFCPYVRVINAADAASRAVLLMSRRLHALGIGPCDVPRMVFPRTLMLRSCLFQKFE